MSWTPQQLPDLTDRTAVVTGANSGIGFHTALELARHGARVVMACRDERSAIDRAGEVRRQTGAEPGVRVLDLASLDSVRAFADGWSGPLDLLVNNAGVMAPPRYRQTQDHHELQFGVNHLGHFALTGRLLPALLASEAARVVTVSSLAHHGGTADLVEGNPKEGYKAQAAYSNSKLANLIFATELQRRAVEHHVTLTSTAAHPGVSNTGLFLDPEGLGRIPGLATLAPLVTRFVLQPASAGAEPTLYAASAAGAGSYSGPQRLRESRGPAGPARRQPLADDADLARALWTVSEEKTGVTYDWSA